MSWAADEWKDGLPQKALSKITDIEAQLERLKKERDQKQFQVESLEQALAVKKRKGTNENSEIARLERENQTLVETCKQLELKRETLITDLELKETHVTSLEGKIAELSSAVSGKITEPAIKQSEQGSDLQSEVIRSLENEIAELRKQVEDKSDAANTSARAGPGDEGGSTKPIRHMSEVEELRKPQQELLTLRSLVSELEAKNKKLVKEGECARHNAEAARLHVEAKMKESEKELKRDLAQALEAAKTAERTLQESKVKGQQELNAAHAEQSKLKILLDKLETENGRLVREQEDLTKRLSVMEDVIKNNDAKVAEADKRRAAWEAEKQSLASDLEHKAREIQAQIAELAKLKNDVGQREQASDILKGQLMDKALESDKFKAEADAASQKLLLAENQLTELQKVQQKTDDHIREMSLSLNQLQKEKETLEGSNVELAKQLQKLQEELQLGTSSLKDTQTQLGQVESNFKESENKWSDLERTLRHELAQSVLSAAELSEQKMALESQLSAKDVEIAELRNRCEASEKKVSGKDEELSQKSQDIIELEKQLQNLQDQHEGLKKENHQQEMFAKEKMAQLEMAVIEKTQELEMFVIQSSQDKTVLEAEGAKLLEEKQTLQLEINSCRFECESSKDLIASLNEEVKTLKEVLENRDMSLAEMGLMVENKDKELDGKKEENVALSTGVNQRDQEIQLMKEKLVSVEKDLEVSQKELQSVCERCEGLEIGTASLISQIEECRRQDECREQVKEQLEKQVADLQSQLDLSQSQCSALSEQVRCDQEKVSVLEKDVESLQTKYSELESHASVLAAGLESKSASCEQLEAQCLQLSQNLDSVNAEKSDLSSKIISLEAQFAECSKCHQETVDGLREQLQEAQKCSDEHKCLLEQKDSLVSELGHEITRLKNGISDLESVRLTQKEDLDGKAALVQSLEKTCASLGDELEALNLTVTEKEQQLRSYLENCSQMETKLRQLEEEKQALEKLAEQLDVLQKERLQKTEDLSQKTSRITELEDQVQDLSNRLSGAQKEAAESDAQHAQEMGTLKSKLDVLEMDIEDSGGQVKDLNGKVLDLTSLLEKATQERDGLKETLLLLSVEVEELKMNSESEQACLVQAKQERDRLTEENLNLKSQLEQMTSLIHSLEEKNAALSDELLASQLKMTEQEHILCSHLEDLSRKENNLRQLEEERKALERTTEQLDLLQKELLKCTQDLSLKDSRITELEDQNEDLNSRLSEAQKEALDLEDKYTHEAGTLKSKLAMLEMDVEDSDGQVQVLNGRISDLTSILEKATQERDGLKETLEQLYEEVGELKMNLESEQACLLQTNQERDKLTEENTTLKNTLTEVQTELERNNSVYEEKDVLIRKIQKDKDEFLKKLEECETERNLLICRLNELEEALGEEKELVLAKTKETGMLSENCCLLSSKLQEVTEQLSEQVLEVSSRTQSLQAVECKLQEIEGNSLMHEERIQKEVEELRLLVLQREESLTKVEKRKEELESVVEDLKSKLKELEGNSVMHEERMQTEVEELRLLVLQREESLETVVKEKEELETIADDLKNKLSQAEQLNSDEVLQHEQNIAIVQSQLEMAQMDVDDKNCLMQELNSKICDLERVIEKMVTEKEEMCEAETALRSGMLELQCALEEEKQNVAQAKLNESSLNEKITSMDTTLAGAQLELEEKEKHLRTLQEQYESLNTRCDQQEKVFIEEREQLNAAVEDIQLCLALEKQTVQSRTEELEAATHRCTELSEHLENVKAELSQLQTELESQVQTQQMLNCKVRDQEVELTMLKEASHEDLEQLQKNVLEKQLELNQKSFRIDDLEKQLVEMTSKLDDVQREKDDDGIHHRQEIAKLHSQLEMLQMDYESEDCEVKELSFKVSSLETEIKKAVSEKEMVVKVVTSLETELVQLKSLLDVEREKATQAKLSEDSMKDRIKLLETSLSAVKLEKQEKESRLQNVQSEYETAKEMIVKHEKTIKEYQIDQDNANTMIRNGHEALEEQKLLVEAKTLELNVVHERYAIVVEQLDEMQRQVVSKQNEIDARVQDVVQLESKINQLEKEKATVRDELSRDIEQLKMLLQSRVGLGKESMVDLGTGKEELNVHMADEQCESGVKHSEEELMLKCKLDILEVDRLEVDRLEVDVKVQEDCRSDQNTNMSSHPVLSSDEPHLKETYQSTNCETKLVYDNSGSSMQSCLDTKEYTERHKSHIEHLKSSFLKFRKAFLENRHGYQSLVIGGDQVGVSQNHISNDVYELDAEAANFECMILSVQQIVDFLMIHVGVQSTQDSNPSGEPATPNPELPSSQKNYAGSEESHLNSVNATLNDTITEHSQMQIEGSVGLYADISGIEGMQVQLSNMQEQCFEAIGESSGDSLHKEKELAMLTSTVQELQNQIEQKNNTVDELANKTINLEIVLSAATEENKNLQTTKASLESENCLLRESHGAVKEETVRLMAEIQRLLAAVADLEKVTMEKTASLETSQQELVKLEQTLEEALDSCENLKLSLSQKTGQISLLETTIKDLESQIEAVNVEQSNLTKLPLQEAETIPLDWSSMKEDLNARCTELEQLKAQFDDASRALVKSNSKLAELQVEKSNLSEQLENVEKLTKSYLQERDNTINILREELDSAAQENDALKTDKGEWQTREDKYKQEIYDLEVKLTDLNMEVVSTRESFESVSNQRFEAQGKLYSALQEQKNLEDRFKEMEVKLEEAKRLVENVQSLELKFEELKEEDVAKEEEIKLLKAQLSEMSLSRLGESDCLQKQKEDLETCLSEANERNRSLEEQLNEVTGVMNEMKEQLAQLQDLMQTLNNSVDTKRKEIVQRVNEICEKNDEIFKLKAVVEETEKLNTEMSKQMADIQKETTSTVGTLQDALESLNFELQAVEEEKMDLAGENEKLKKESQELHEKIKGLVNGNPQEGLRSGEPTSQASHQDLGTLQDALESLNFELQAVEEEKKDLAGENKRLKKESQELHEKIKGLINGNPQEGLRSGEPTSQASHQDLGTLQDALESLNFELQAVEEEKKDLAGENEKLKKESQELHEKIKGLINGNPQEGLRSGEPTSQASHQDLGTLQDALESLNFELQAAEEEKKVLAGENERLKKESQELHEKIKGLVNGNLQEGCSSGASGTNTSHQDLGTLQDAIESLNFELRAVEEEKDALVSENEFLKKKGIDLYENIQKLIDDSEITTNGDLNKPFSSLEQLASDLTEYVHSLERKNNDMKQQLGEELKATSDLSAQVQSLNELLQEKTTICENLTVQVESLTADANSSIQKLKEKEDVLCKSKDVEECLNARILEVSNQITSLHLDLDCKNDQIENLKNEHENIFAKYKELESVIVHLQEVLKQEVEAGRALKENLQTKEMAAADLSKFEQMIQDFNLVILEKDQLKERVETLAHVENDNQELKEVVKTELDKQSVLEQKVEDLEKELVRRGNLDEMLDAVELEKHSLRETVERAELARQLLDNKVKEMEKEMEDLMQGKDLFEKKIMKLECDNCGLEETVKEMTKVVDDLTNEKASLEDNVIRLESQNRLVEDRLKVQNQKVDNLTDEKISLQTVVKKLECDNCQLAEKLKELDRIIEHSASEKVSLQDEIKKLECDNCHLEEKLKELDQIIEHSALEKVSLQEEVKKLECDNCQIEEKRKELVQMTEYVMLEKTEKALLQDEVSKLKSSNCQLENRLKELNQMLEGSELEKTSLQDEVKTLKVSNCQLESKLKEWDQLIENAAEEKATLLNEVQKFQSTKCEAEDRLKELNQLIENAAVEKVSLQEEIQKLKSNNYQLEGKLKELDQLIENAALDKVSLQDEVKKLQSSNCEAENKLKELDQLIENAAIEKVSLQDEVKKLQSSNCEAEEKLKELDQLIENAAIEKVSFQDHIQTLESSNCQLEGKLKALNQKLEDITLEKASIQDKLQILESGNHQLEDQLKEMVAAASEHVQLKEKFEAQEKNLAETLRELSQSAAEKAHLESQLKDLQNQHSQTPVSEGSNSSGQINEHHKELLRKWEQRCSELSAQLAMDRKKIQRLTDQVEKLKSAKEVDSVDDSKFQALREELDEVKEERDVYQEKFMKMSKAAERHFNKSNDMQRLNEKLNSRNKLLNALLKGEKPRMIVAVQGTGFSLNFGAQNLQSGPNTGESTEASNTAQGKGGGSMSGNTSEQGLPSCESKPEESDVHLSESVSGDRDGSCQADTAQAHSVSEETKTVGLHAKEKLISDVDTAKPQMIVEKDNQMSPRIKEKLISEDAQSKVEKGNKTSSNSKDKFICDVHTVEGDGLLEENNVISHVSEKLCTDSVQAHSASKVNIQASWDTKEKPTPAENSQNLAGANNQMDSSIGGLYTTRSSTRLKLRSPKAQCVQKSRPTTPKSAIPPQLVLSTQKQKAEFISDVVPSLLKMQTPPLKHSEMSLSKLKTSALKVPESPLKKQTFSNVSFFKAEKMPAKSSDLSTDNAVVSDLSSSRSKISQPPNSTSKISDPSNSTSKVSDPSNSTSKVSDPTNSTSKVSHLSNSTTKVSHLSNSTTTVSSRANALGPESNVRQPIDAPDELKPLPSPRVSRRMSLQKRRSTDQSLEAAGGKKSKLTVQEPVPETKSTTGGKIFAHTSRLPQPASTRTGQATGLPRPMRTRSRQDALASQSQKALTTITNSPKKTLSQESKPLRTTRATAKRVTSPPAQAAEEGASDCKIN